MADFNRATLMAMLPEWSLTLSLIFAGCCSNAYYLEQATRIQPACGTLLTFLQFIFTTLQMLPTQLRFRDEKTGKRYIRPRFESPKIPLKRWSAQVAMYFGTTILNNTAFSFHVPVPVHIIFRSGGLVVSMLAGYFLRGRRYTPTQIVSVLLVTAGVIISTLATTPESGDDSASASSGPSATTYFAGIGLLTAALFVSAVMGLYQEQTYGVYGKQHWQEGLFYNHFLSLPLFALRATSMHSLLSPGAIYDLRQWFNVAFGSFSFLPIGFGSATSSLPSIGIIMPILIPALALNVLTQLICVNGVNRLTAMCSSLTVTLVLVVRKAVSLAISVLIIAPALGEEVHGKGMLFVGATSVLIGTLGYALGTASTSKDEKKKEEDIKTVKTQARSTAISDRSNGKAKRRG
ncbi:UAA transporter [Meira miltonrushii]|uniref:UAA transporter n=1 Tax=Meira miltonrushii TaxID=1280837 RepID=A0A316V322_9BASI|nr:UAA transporter [Meira miltonrushii]PWN31959.1 UAA transporter [Meira miltonrushii]